MRSAPFVRVVFAALTLGVGGVGAAIGCGRTLNDEQPRAEAGVDPPREGGAPSVDASEDAGPPSSTCVGRFSSTLATVDVNPGYPVRSFARFLPDERTMFFAAGLTEDGRNLWVATRADRSAPFAADGGALLPFTDAVDPEDGPTPLPDGLALAYVRIPKSADGGGGASSVWIAWRTSTDVPFEAPVELNLGAAPDSPFFSLDGTELWFAQAGELKVAARQGRTFGAPYVPVIVAPGNRQAPVLSADKLTLFFAAGAPLRVYEAHRSSVAAPWEEAALVGELPLFSATYPTWLSPDGCRLYLTTSDESVATLRVATRSR